MNSISDILGFILVLLVLTMQWMVFVNRIFLVFSLNSLVVAVAFFILGIHTGTMEYFVIAGLTVLIRAFLIPMITSFNLHKRPERVREDAPLVPTASGILVSMALILTALALFRYVLLPRFGVLNESGGLALALILQGAFLIVSKRNSFIQFSGYLVVENGVLLFAAWNFPVIPLILEGAVALDLLGLVVIAGIVMRLRERRTEGDTPFAIAAEHEDLKG
jgi:hydrogenase-4 component E